MDSVERVQEDDRLPEDIQLVGAHEIRELLNGRSRQRVYQLTSRADFPKAVAELAQGKVWLADEVQEWIDAHRQSGRMRTP